ncbi:MAG: DUF4424 family protein [Alphaproteobacteria bacterium]|nr:DUF4424 family protein [Alphaproteobacteria bacterium]
MHKILIILLTISTLFSAQVLANDTVATVAGGGVEYQKSEDISMDEELLQISIDKINITYKFTNHSDRKIKTKVAFPLPPFPEAPSNKFAAWDEMYYAHKFIEENPTKNKEVSHNVSLNESTQNRPFINFQRTVDGMSYGYQYQVIAKNADGKDITELLTKNKIPLSVQYLYGAMEEGYLYHDKKMAQRLKDLKLVDSKGHPTWTTQTIYYWDQYFEPNKTHTISHSYRPHTGLHFMDAVNPQTLDEIKLGEDYNLPKMDWKDYNLDEQSVAAILKSFKDNPEKQYQYVQEVRYILTTGANWKGPIKKFRLEVTPLEPDSLVLCNWPGDVTRMPDGKYVVEVNNFNPKEDLKLLFLRFSPK